MLFLIRSYRDSYLFFFLGGGILKQIVVIGIGGMRPYPYTAP